MDKSKLLSRTKCGMIRQCSTCNKYNISFNNIFLEFTQTELENFKSYLDLIDVEFWQEEYGTINKSIPIPTNQYNLILVFNVSEFEELKELLSFKNKIYDSLSYADLEQNFCPN
ncbi:hypothetical protein N9T81_01765 [Flavobacteriaceae bacterium]|jgi:hypothetical protein|nr:hypothetical protein [Flavobacteriaceae bacterium]|tara:strand:+ start:2466 stop:2807 length:342 start_codon:yes stop_codon:yes gene_type:complete